MRYVLFANFTYSSFCRSPFELNTTMRCILMAILQQLSISFAFLIATTVLGLLVGVTMYARAISIDIKSLSNQIDQLIESNDRKTEMTMFKLCKEAIVLQIRLYRYLPKTCILYQLLLSNTNFWLTQLHGPIG